MANTIHLISKKYLDPHEVSNTVEIIAQRLNYSAGKSYSQEYAYIEINLFIEDIPGYLRISIDCGPDHFNKTFDALYNINGYGMLIEIECYYDNPLLIPFLVEMLKEIPELLVYDEDTLQGDGAYIYTLSHLENFSEKSDNLIFGNPPQDL
ncbi:MAG TPA: hypothetical protein DIT10_11245 [Chryseobacterium sp.]|nr:hypothetical protein [Chryseobacterium sp.]